MYMRELDERKLERAVALDKVTTRQTIKVTVMSNQLVISLISLRYELNWQDKLWRRFLYSYLQEGSLPKISLPAQGRDYTQDVDSDQESLGNMFTENRRGQARMRRHTLPPILAEAEP